MITNRWIQWQGLSALVALALCVVAARAAAAKAVAPPDTAAAFKEFSARVQTYLKLQKAVESSLPSLKATDVPEMITAHQQALARTIREARPQAKQGDIFTPAACEAFRHISRAALAGPHSANSRAYMQAGAPNQRMSLVVNAVYPDTEPTTPFPPALLAAFPPLPVEVAYRLVGRTLILVDVRSRLIVDVALLILPPAP